MDKLRTALDSDKEKSRIAVTVNSETFFVEPMQTLYLESNAHTLIIVTSGENKSTKWLSLMCLNLFRRISYSVIKAMR